MRQWLGVDGGGGLQSLPWDGLILANVYNDGTSVCLSLSVCPNLLLTFQLRKSEDFSISKPLSSHATDAATGGELFERVAGSGPLVEASARPYLHQLLDALAPCHARGVYHRYRRCH